jgi:hypothetical protein
MQSKKDIDNIPTDLRRRNRVAVFMSVNNQQYLVKHIYQLHKNNNGQFNYLYFKDIITKKMRTWLDRNNIKMYEIMRESADFLSYVNKLFIRDNEDLYNLGYNINPVDSNVARNTISIGYMTHGDETLIMNKRIQDIYAEDIKNMDVWREQTTEVSNSNKRYNNQIVPWQASMHTRNYDRDNQGYAHADPMRASLTTNVYGYGDDMENLKKISDISVYSRQHRKKYA